MVPATAGLFACGKKKSPRYQGYALIASRESHSVAVLDLSRFQMLKEIPLDAPPSWVIASPPHSRAYILSADSSGMNVLNLDTMILEKRLPLGGRPSASILSRDGTTLWVALQAPNILAALDTSSGASLKRIALPAPANDIDEWNGYVAIAFRNDRRVARYRSGSASLLVSGMLDAEPHLIRIRPDGKILLTGNTGDRSMTAIHAATLNAMVKLPLSLEPKHFCFNNDGGQLFVTGDGMDAVVIVSPYQTEVNETILAGNAPGSMATTSSAPNYLFVANPQSGDITVINIDNRKVLAQVHVGQRPGTVLLTPDNEYALVLN